MANYLTVIDEDASQFTIVGPCLDPGSWDRRVDRARARGRRVKLEPAANNDIATITRIARATALKYCLTSTL